MSVCKYSSKYLPLVESWKSKYSPEEVKKLIEEHFTNPNDVAGVDMAPASSYGDTPVEIVGLQGKNPDLTSEEIEDAVKQLSNFVGNRKVVIGMERGFKKTILGCAIVSLNGDSLDFHRADEMLSNGADRINDRILSYKLELVNRVRNFLGLEEISSFKGSDGKYLSDAEITKIIRDTIKEGVNRRAELENTDLAGSMDARVSFVLLANFDNYLDKFTKFVVPKDIPSREGVSKYVYTGPNVKHFSNFSSSEFAKAEDQASDLIRVILDVIPEVDPNGNVIEGSSVGMSGFNAAMMSLKDLMLYSEELSQEAVATMELGVDKIAFGPKEYSRMGSMPITVNLIQEYLDVAEKHNAQNSRDVKEFYDNRKRFLTSKMRGLQKFVFNGNKGSEEEQFVKKCLINMFYKTENVSYRAYGFNSISQKYEGQNLTNYVLNTQKLQLQDTISSALMAIKNSPVRKADLREAYNIQIKDNTLTITTKDGTTLTIGYTNVDNAGYAVTDITSDNTLFDDDYREIIEDFLYYVVPDTYATANSKEPNEDWFRDFAPFIVMAGLVATNHSVGLEGNTWATKSNQHLQLLKAAEKIVTIYGGDTKNVVKNLTGGKLPVNQLTALAFRIKSLINDARARSSIENDNILVKTSILGKPQVRNEVVYGGKSKKATDLTVKELMQISVLDDFLFSMDSGEIYLQSATYSDKGTHFLQSYRINEKLNLTEEAKRKLAEVGFNATDDTTLKDLIDLAKTNDEPLLELVRIQRANRIERFTEKIIEDYRNAYRGTATEVPASVTTLTDLDNWAVTNKITLNSAKEQFKSKGLVFRNEMYGTVYKAKLEQFKNDVKGQLHMNETLLNWSVQFSSRSNWKNYINKCKQKYIKTILDNHLEMFSYKDDRVKTLVGMLDNVNKDASGKTQRDRFYDENSRKLSIVSSTGEIHPAFQAFFATDLLLSHELNSLTIGEVAAHTNKSSGATNIEEFYEFSEASRLVNQIKRSVIFGATMHTFAQGLKDGVAERIHIAVIDDMKGNVSTPNGVTGDVDSMDGSGQCCSLQSRAENKSLLDAAVGNNKKTILHSIDYTTGTPQLLKWAVYELTNEVRRDSTTSKSSAERTTKKMYSRALIDKALDIAAVYNQYVKDTGYICYKDFDEGTYYRILRVENLGNNTFNVITEQIDPKSGARIGEGDPKKSAPVKVDYLYDIDQMFGGAWAGKVDFNEGTNDRSFEYAEGNIDILETVVNDTNLKDKFIAYCVNSSAIKVGACNVNPSSCWENGDALSTFQITTKYGGIQGDYDHHLEDAEVTEMTQMISSLIENGYYTDKVVAIYQEIGNIVASKIKDLVSAVDSKDIPKVYEILGEALISSFDSGTKDTLGVAQVFVKKAKTAIDNYKKTHKDFKFEIPFSAATISPAFIAGVASDINSSAIRHKYEGFAGVLNPSHNMMQYYRVYTDGGEEQVKLFEQFADECRDRLKPILASDYKGSRTYTDIAQNDFWVTTKDGSLAINPFIKKISINDIDFEDTIWLVDIEGNVVDSFYIETFEDFDNLKYFTNMTSPDGTTYSLYRNTAAPKNLRGYDVTFEVQGKKYHIYDLDSVRATFYAKRYKDNFLANPSLAERAVMGNIFARNYGKVKRPYYAWGNAKWKDDTKVIDLSTGGDAFSSRYSALNAIFKEGTFWTLKDGTKINISGKSVEQVYQYLLKANNRDVKTWRKDVWRNKTGAPVEGSDLYTTAYTEASDLQDFSYENGYLPLWKLYASQNPEMISELKDQITPGTRLIDSKNRANTRVNQARAWADILTLSEYYQAVEEMAKKETQEVLKRLDVGNEYESTGEASPIGLFPSSVAFGTTGDVIAENVAVRNPEIITGRYQGEKFGLNQNDHIYDILAQGPSFFRRKLSSRFSSSVDAEENTYDHILYKEGGQVLVKVTENPSKIFSNYHLDTSYIHDNGKLYYISENGQRTFVCNDAEEEINFYIWDSEEGEGTTNHSLAIVSNRKAYNTLSRSKYFEKYKYDNITESNYGDIISDLFKPGENFIELNSRSGKYFMSRKEINNLVDNDIPALVEILRANAVANRENMLDDMAADQFEAFRIQLDYVGARIPTQAMSSFMPMTVVAYTNVTTNVVYVPKAQTFLEGSDYDIDKLYILAYTISKTGRFRTGSDLDYYTPDIVSRLDKANGTTYEKADAVDDNTIVLNSKQLELLLSKPAYNAVTSKNTIVNTLNKIFRSDKNKIYIDFNGETPTKEQLGKWEKLVKILNDHSLTDGNTSSSEDALKNRTVSGISTITRGIQNQLIAQIAVDEVTKRPKSIAANSPSGQAEKLLTQDNPFDKFVMQVQNGVGKQDVGIGAVSMKAFFAMTTAYNRKIANIVKTAKSVSKDEAIKLISEELSKLIGDNCWTGRASVDERGNETVFYDKGILAGVNLDPLIELVNELGITTINVPSDLYISRDVRWRVNGIRGAVDLPKCLKILKATSSKVDPAQVLSALISLSADNAKDLALAKLNATPELLDIYTYATMIGVDFADIAKVMTSEIFNFATKVGEVNIFDVSTHSSKTKDYLSFLLNKDIPKISSSALAYIFKNTNIFKKGGIFEGSKINKKTILEFFKLDDGYQVKSTLEEAIRLIDEELISLETRRRTSDEEGAEQAEEMLDSQGNVVETYIPSVEDMGVLRNMLVWKLRQITYTSEKRPDGFTEDDYKALEKINNLLDGVEEMSTLGRTLGINQGLKTDLYDIYSFSKNLESFIRERGDSLKEFTLVDFIKRPEYWIDLYEDHKISFNILDVLMSVPHFSEMIKATGVLNGALSSTSSRYNTCMRLADELCRKVGSKNLTREEFKELQYYVSDLYIADFIDKLNETKPIVLRIPKGGSIYSSFSSAAAIVTAGSTPLKLQGTLAIGSFKKSMDDAIFLNLKKEARPGGRFEGNRFLQALVPFYLDKGRLKKGGWKLPFDMMDTSSSPNIDAMYTRILEDFTKIAREDYCGMKIGDMIFLYNLILNKDAFGRDSLTKIFEDLAEKNPTPLVEGYYQMITANDATSSEHPEGLQSGTIEELSYRIAKNVESSRITDLNITGRVQVNPIDFPVDLPNALHIPVAAVAPITIESSDMDSGVKVVSKYLSAQEAVIALANFIGAKYKGSEANGGVECITDEEIEKDERFKGSDRFKQANAFIYNGRVFINIDHCSLAAGIHEYAHLILAQMKYSEDEVTRNTYFDLLALVKTDDRYKTYSEMYGGDGTVVGSDLDEEVFCKVFEDYLCSRTTPQSQVTLRLNGTQLTAHSIKEAFGFDGTLKDGDIMGRTLDEVLSAFGASMFTDQSPQKDTVQVSQKIATIKAKLATNSSEDENSLDLDCD